MKILHLGNVFARIREKQRLADVEIAYTSRQLRKARDRLNRLRKTVIGQERIYRLEQITAFLDALADESETLYRVESFTQADSMPRVGAFTVREAVLVPVTRDDPEDDLLFLRRLVWDLAAASAAANDKPMPKWKGRRP